MHGTLLSVFYLFVCCVSGDWSRVMTKGFHYVHDSGTLYRRASSEDCRICDGVEDCLSLDEARCEYYIQSSTALQGSEDSEDDRDSAPELRAEVDSIMYSLVDKASMDPRFNDCLPFISTYTNCHKENICTGCTTCICDTEGRWNCTAKQQCKPDAATNINHRALLLLLDKFEEKRTTQYPNEKLSNLVKRSIKNESTTEGKINFDELYGWLSPDDQLTDDNNTTDQASSNVVTMETPITDIQSTTMTETETEPDFLAFDEVLDIMAVNKKNYSSRKLPSDTKQHEKIISNDYIDYHDEPFFFYKGSNLTDNVTDNVTYYDVTEPTVVDTFTEEVTNSVINEVTTIVTDLLYSAGVIEENNDKFLDDINIDNEQDIFNNESNHIESNSLNAVNVMKREVKNTNNTIETTSSAIINTTQHYLTDPSQDLNAKVLIPLSKILNNKNKEIYELLKIKNNLITFMKANTQVFNNNEGFMDHKLSSNLSTYNLGLALPIDVDLRRSNTSILDKYMIKLEHDVKEVMRDIVNIKKYTDLKKLPENIKFLTRAMKFYVHKNGFHEQKNINAKQRSSAVKSYRRNWGTIDIHDQNPIVYYIIRILELIDKNMPSSNALQPLSKTTRKVMMRLCKQNYFDESSIIGQRVYDPHYNLTGDIKNIGTEWQKASSDIAFTPPSELLYHFKLLHLVLSNDMNKISNALALIDFAHSRRMVPIDDNLGEEIITKINNNLRSIDRKVKAYVHRNDIKLKKGLRVKTKYYRKKESFMNQIKRLLKNSKPDVRRLLHKKVPQSLVVKELAKKKKNRLSESKLFQYEEIMRKWQNNLKIPTERQKRSLDFSNRMKSIIPKYLRKKVNYTAHKKKGRKVHSTTLTALFHGGRHNATLKPIITTKNPKNFH